MICFLSVGEIKQDLCFKSEIPLEFDNLPSCKFNLDRVADYMHSDLLERNTTILFHCVNDSKINL